MRDHSATKPASIRPNLRAAYPVGAVILHWSMAILIFALIVMGWYMVDIPRGTPARGYWFNIHKSIGMIAFFVAALFLVWRSLATPPPLPRSVPPWEVRAAAVGHWLLYLGLIVVPLTGYIEANFTKWGVDFFGYKLEPWGWDQEPGNTIYTLFNRIHVWGSWVFAAVIGLHVAAALKHALQRDGVMGRMLPLPGSSRRR
jgi:cytochrome b561